VARPIGDILRSRDWTDRVLAINPDRARKIKRTIKNYANYRTSGGVWMPSTPGLSALQGIPPDWSGACEFSHGSLRSAAQFFVRDGTDVDNRALIGMRRSDEPSSWLNIKALNVAGGIEPVISADSLSATYTDLWTNTILEYVLGPGGCEQFLSLTSVGHPGYFEFSLKKSGGLSYAIDEQSGVVQLLDADGEERMRMGPYWAHDSTVDAGSVSNVGVALSDQGTLQGNRVIRITFDADDLANAVYPVVVQ